MAQNGVKCAGIDDLRWTETGRNGEALERRLDTAPAYIFP